MKKLILIGALIAVTTGSAEIFRPEQRKFLENTPYLISKDTKTIPGKIILTWNCCGKFHHCTTQEVFTLTGQRNMSPLRKAYIQSTNHFAIVKARYEELQAKNVEANQQLNEIASKYPILKSLVEKIRARIATKVEKIEDVIKQAEEAAKNN